MRFEWDDQKNLSNQKKHGVSFEIAELVYSDPYRREVEVQYVDDEERLVSIGRLPTGQLLYVVATERVHADEDIIRIISARRTTRHEQRGHEGHS